MAVLLLLALVQYARALRTEIRKVNTRWNVIAPCERASVWAQKTKQNSNCIHHIELNALSRNDLIRVACEWVGHLLLSNRCLFLGKQWILFYSISILILFDVSPKGSRRAETVKSKVKWNAVSHMWNPFIHLEKEHSKWHLTQFTSTFDPLKYVESQLE